ncbi:MAG TPA: Rid family detoxifying hydrolase [Denitromonas sp.]|uniref:Rid family detoxifying hydrolase n=1 Tax=Denitromonas sp. TaxID=2734609 RepID=UPI002C84315A|nr:Rid family detoxifying hydrolase [Denitromonas sp.]HQU88186.1 Rid family detoxifying hydrolase [Denitromonas sp.]HQV15462.1 Rid family detoxifying hydrolase [Denitromonas sp.]
MNVVSTPNAPQAIGPYSQAIALDGLLFTSGQIPLATDGSKVEGDIAAQTEQVFNNLEGILTSTGATLADVIKVTVFMTDLGEFAAMNAVFAKRFGEHRPARSTVQVVALPTGARVEIEAIARLAR